MFSRTRGDLVGKHFEGLIGEPWDFVSEAGEAKLAGTITAVSIGDVEWVLMEISPFVFNGKKIIQVVGINRYVSSQDVFAELLKGNRVGMNFMFLKDGKRLLPEKVVFELENRINDFSFVVGSVYKILW